MCIRDRVIDDIQTAMKYKKIHKKEHPTINVAERRRVVDSYNGKQELLREDFESGISKKTVGHAFVTFEYMKDVADFLDYYEPKTFWQKLGFGKRRLEFRGAPLKFCPAPEPSDICWENLHISKLSRYIRRSTGFMVSTSILVMSSVLVLYVSYVEESALKRKLDNFYLNFIAIGAPVVILLINEVLALAIRALATFEGYSTKTKFYISVAEKLALAQFFNTAMVTLAVKAIFDTNFWGEGGLIQTMTLIFLTNALSGPLSSILFNYSYLSKMIKKWFVQRDQANCHYTQAELNKVYEGIDFDISARYANLSLIHI
eukprot:TRINITY_DN27373_c0_g1_i1.p1 TRINITY_DN27373_c0_g1~~TRINITY_DN27373_c0_g1_i1.p1  ORF type:complete len:335 (-),score=54.05 TRINITY_DN27373_c0_g1_i1:59-1006(-)